METVQIAATLSARRALRRDRSVAHPKWGNGTVRTPIALSRSSKDPDRDTIDYRDHSQVPAPRFKSAPTVQHCLNRRLLAQ
jgi:hypothetical protein